MTRPEAPTTTSLKLPVLKLSKINATATGKYKKN